MAVADALKDLSAASQAIPEGRGDDIVVVGNKKSSTPGSFTLNSFISDIRHRGVVRSHSFMVNIVPPKILRGMWTDMRPVILRCDSAALPAANFQTFELFRHGYGPQESSPHNVQFEPVNLTFILDASAELYTFWYTWLNAIMNFNRSRGLNTSDGFNKAPYELAYKDDYSTEIKILVYNEATDNIIQASLLAAFPLGMNEVSLNWADQSGVVRLNIPISYRDYYSQTAKASGVSIFDFLSGTVEPKNLVKNLVKDQFNFLSTNIIDKGMSKLDRLISDIIL